MGTRIYNNSLTAEFVRQIFNYDPETGILTWKEALNWRIVIGSTAGSIKKGGRIQVKVNGRMYQVHRIIWLYVTGEWPNYEIDHKDLNPGNNIWTNLRPATTQQNCYNRPMFKNNTSGFKGVRYKKSTGKWEARIKHMYKDVQIGTFNTVEEAVQAYEEASKRLAGEFAYDAT
jgi:hypothetical protein